MKNIYTLFAIMAIVMGSSSCAKIDSLSDSNAIAEFRIIAHQPTAIELGDVHITNDTIYIPIVYGKYDFPLRFYAQTKIDEKIDRVVGLDFSKELCLNSIDDVLKFYVQALSGMTRTYYIVAREVPLDENYYISPRVDILGCSPSTIFAPLGSISPKGDTLRVYAVEPQYPLSVTPRFTIAETSSFVDFSNGTQSLYFNNASTFHKIRVLAKSGAENTWNVRVVPLKLLSGMDVGDDPARRETTNVEPRTFSASITGNWAVDESAVDNNAETITLIVKAQQVGATLQFPLDAHLKMEAFPGIQMLGMAVDTTVTFASKTDVHWFYMLDTQECVARHYRVVLKEWKNNKADVLTFSYNYTADKVNTLFGLGGTASIVLDKAKIGIYPERGEITVAATAITDQTGVTGGSWKLTMNGMGITLSPGATSNLLTSYVWAGNGSWQTPQTFIVTAADGTQKQWKIIVKDTRNYTASAVCNIESMAITKVIPNYTVLSAELPDIDINTHTVSIKLIDDDGCYPMSIYTNSIVSRYASIVSQNKGADPLVFNSAEDTQVITVKAENGTTADWTVKLISPPASVGANVADFGVTAMSPVTFGVASTEIDADNGVLNIYLSKAGMTMPLNVTYSITPSTRATANIPLRGTFVFNSLSESKSFVITAQDKVTQRTWAVKLIYMPQLENWNLNGWSNNTTPVYWATANNSMVTGTTMTAGITGSSTDKAALLSTSTAMGNMAAGSLFLGQFKFNLTDGLNNPQKLTWFGLPFVTTGKIIGVDFDMAYHPGNGAGSDTGSVTVDLVKFDGVGTYEYHGGDWVNNVFTPSKYNNTHALLVTRGNMVFGTKAATASDGTPVKVVADGQWMTMSVRVADTSERIRDFNYLSICFSSSSDGDQFIGATGSTLKIDNVRIIYEN